MLFARRPTSVRDPSSVLVSAGEASGDRLAGSVAHVLQRRGIETFGLGGPACAAAGVELVADLRRVSSMGTVEVASRFPAAIASLVRICRVVSGRRPRAALLVDFTEYNLRLGRYLRARGVRVLWCGAPQVWAWRGGRMGRIGCSLDRLAVLLPFEVPLWRSAGVDAHYVGHPALEGTMAGRDEARAALGIDPRRECVALLPGSRPGEVLRHLGPMLKAIARLALARPGLEARVLLAPSLDRATRGVLAQSAARSGVALVDVDPSAGTRPLLRAFDVAICASGTATLECALAAVPPLVVYRMAKVTFAIARRLVRSPHMALPNVLLGERRYPELVQDEVEPSRMAAALAALLATAPRFRASADELRRRLGDIDLGPGSTGERVAELLMPWLPASNSPMDVPSTPMVSPWSA